jgi:RNA exonuclease 1
MFTSKGFFSEVPCPHQQNCILPNCIFQHAERDVKSAVPAANFQDNAHATSDQDEARKRRKLDDDSLTSNPGAPSKSGHEVEAHKHVEPHKASPQLPDTPGGTKQKVFTRDREISPPPLRKKPQPGNSVPAKQPHAHNNGNGTPLKAQPSSATPTPITPKVATKTPVKAPAKKESLNPRVLKTQAPASHDMRYRLLRALHEQLNRLNSELAKDANDEEEKSVLSEQELITKALDIEEEAAFSTAIYSNIVKNKILVYKRMTVPQWKDERGKELAKAKAAEVASISDTPVSKPTEPPKPIETRLSPEEELELLPRLYTPISGLSKHGYVTSIPSNEEIEKAKKGVEAAKGWEVCDRCKSRFQVFPGRREEDGALASGGTCTYHFGKPFWQERSAVDPGAKREKKYRCCGQSMGDSPGCTQADSHVFKISEVKRMATVMNFEKTPDTPEKPSAWPVCIDGEMGYTVYGLELIRLTATSWPSGKELFDVLVRPIGEILDLNSRYSGVWPKDMAEAIPWDAPPDAAPPTSEETTHTKRRLRIVDSPEAARALLFSHLSPETPLIGHGLENDLNATRIIHPTIIDTALLFPHKAGLPYRNGLKMLMHTHLNRHIQVVVNGKMEGHDSKEDANAAGELVRFALANEWQKMEKAGWTLQDGKFKAPPQKSSFPRPPTGPMAGLTVEYLEDDPARRKRSRDEMEDAEEGEID